MIARTLSALSIALVVLSVAWRAPAAETGGESEAPDETTAVDTATDETAGDSGDVENAGDVRDVEDKGKDDGGFLTYEEPEMRTSGSFAGLMLRLVLSMAIIIGLIYGALMLFRLLARKAKVAPKSEKLIRIIDRAPLDPKRAVYLVKVVDRLLVIGVGTNEVRTLAQIDDETIVENVQETEFSGHLQSLFSRLTGRQA